MTAPVADTPDPAAAINLAIGTLDDIGNGRMLPVSEIEDIVTAANHAIDELVARARVGDELREALRELLEGIDAYADVAGFPWYSTAADVGLTAAHRRAKDALRVAAAVTAEPPAVSMLVVPEDQFIREKLRADGLDRVRLAALAHVAEALGLVDGEIPESLYAAHRVLANATVDGAAVVPCPEPPGDPT